MDGLIVNDIPELDDPIAVLAFEGWNDAGAAATGAARFLNWRLGGRAFATIDPEAYFSFTDARPDVKTTTRSQRIIEWPKNEFSYVRGQNGGRDLIVFVGTEPSLRWRSFTQMFTSLFEEMNVRFVVSLGALLADVPHTREPRVSGSALDPDLAGLLGLSTSRYEGPTGIVGVLTRALTDAGIDVISLWSNVPHYLTSDRNPPGSLALLRRLETVLNRNLDLRDMVRTADRFRTEVDQVIAENDEVGEYVRRLEAAWDRGDMEEDEPESADLPSASDVLRDIERLLRDQRRDD